MKKIRIIVLLCFNLSFFAVYSQSTIDSATIFLNAKMRLLEYAFTNVYEYDALQGFIRYQPNISVLKSTGFNDNELFFFQILAEPFVDISQSVYSLNGEVGYFTYFSNLEYKFVFGYNLNNNELYLLNGYQDDFRRLYSYNREICSDKYSIEDLDLECLCKSVKKQKNKCPKPSFIYSGSVW